MTEEDRILTIAGIEECEVKRFKDVQGNYHTKRKLAAYSNLQIFMRNMIIAPHGTPPPVYDEMLNKAIKNIYNNLDSINFLYKEYEGSSDAN